MAAINEDPTGDADVQLDEDDDEEDSPADHKRKDKEKAKVKFSAVMQRAEAVAYFSALVDGLRHGRLQFRHGDESVALEPTEQVLIEVKAVKKGDKERVAFELEWRRGPREPLEVSG